MAGASVVAAQTMFVTRIPAIGTAYRVFVPSNLTLFLPLIASITVPSAFIFGLPAFFLLRKAELLSLAPVVLVGLSGGMVMSLLLFSPADWLNFAVVGLVSALVAFLLMYCLGVTRSGRAKP
jgi:hypothetical protein